MEMVQTTRRFALLLWNGGGTLTFAFWFTSGFVACGWRRTSLSQGGSHGYWQYETVWIRASPCYAQCTTVSVVLLFQRRQRKLVESSQTLCCGCMWQSFSGWFCSGNTCCDKPCSTHKACTCSSWYVITHCAPFLSPASNAWWPWTFSVKELRASFFLSCSGDSFKWLRSCA